jgi:peroxiredoxin
MLAAGDRVPDVRLWLDPRESRTVHELVAEQPALLFFYLFDWSST